jgi:hypothetical protein
MASRGRQVHRPEGFLSVPDASTTSQKTPKAKKVDKRVESVDTKPTDSNDGPKIVIEFVDTSQKVGSERKGSRDGHDRNNFQSPSGSRRSRTESPKGEDGRSKSRRPTRRRRDQNE